MGGSAFRQALLLTLSIWLVFVYGSYCVSELIGGRAGFLRDLPFDIPAMLLIALIAFSLWPVARRTADWPLPARFAAIVAAAVLVAIAQSLVNLLENRLLGVIPALDGRYLDMIRERFARMFLSHAYLSFANAAMLLILVEMWRAADQRVLIAQSEVAASEARATALRLQLNPHFLFNTLNSISSLIVTRRVDDAEEMIERLAEFLRHSLQSDPSALVTLDEEFETISNYLAIEAVRFGDRMTVELDYPPECAKVEVPGLILQPLVENAVKYGVARSMRPVTVRVTARCEEGRVIIRVCDDAEADGQARPPVGLGIGVDNIVQRLASRYGQQAELSLERGAPGYTAVVKLPPF